MASLFLFLKSLQLLLLMITTATAKSCPRPKSCSQLGSTPTVRFPFQIVSNDHGDLDQSLCAYPGFELSCNYADRDHRDETIVSLPAGDFSVISINYASQTLTIGLNDSKCLPRVFLEKNFTLSGTPFRVETLANVTFLNCSSLSDYFYYGTNFEAVPCLSGQGFTVVTTPTAFFEFLPSFCGVLGSVPVPVVSSKHLSFDQNWEFYFGSSVRLAWDQPRCGSCELSGGECRLIGVGSLETGCYNLSKPGLSKTIQIVIYIILAVAIVAFFVSNCHLKRSVTRPSNIARVYSRNRSQPLESTSNISEPNQQSQTNNNNPNNIIVASPGLDERVIETYPKSVVGESRRLLSSNYKSCPICLCEYLSKDTLRTLPDCFHYFHSDCIDEWLRLNASCPLCRNSPLVSPFVRQAAR